MLILPHQKKIFFIGASLFVTMFSLLLFFVGGDGSGDHLKTSVFGDLLERDASFQDLHESEVGLALDSHGSVIDGSPVFFDTFLFRSDDLLSRDIFSLLSGDEVSAFAKVLLDAQNKGALVPLTGPYHVLDGSGRTRIVLITIQPLSKKKKDEKGAATLVYFKDISDSFGKSGDGENGSDGVGSAPSEKSIKNMPNNEDQKNRIIVEKTG